MEVYVNRRSIKKKKLGIAISPWFTLVCIFLLAVFVQLQCANPTRFVKSDEFDQGATKFFVANIDSFDLSPLNNAEKCILVESISHNLKEFSNSTTVFLYDRYLVRTYYQTVLQLRINFVYDVSTERFYFVMLPQLYKMLVDVNVNCELNEDGRFKLRTQRGLVKVNSQLLTRFLMEQGLLHSDDCNVTRTLLHTLVPELVQGNTSVSLFKERMRRDIETGIISDSSSHEIEELIKEHNLEIFNVEYVGFVVFEYCSAAPSLNGVQVHLIPELEGRFISNPILLDKQSKCF